MDNSLSSFLKIYINFTCAHKKSVRNFFFSSETRSYREICIERKIKKKFARLWMWLWSPFEMLFAISSHPRIGSCYLCNVSMRISDKLCQQKIRFVLWIIRLLWKFQQVIESIVCTGHSIVFKSKCRSEQSSRLYVFNKIHSIEQHNLSLNDGSAVYGSIVTSYILPK